MRVPAYSGPAKLKQRLTTFRYACNKPETQMRIAIQGEPGSFSHVAALQMVPRAKVVPCPVAREVLASVRNRRADAIVLPVENSLAGTVGEHLDLLFASGLSIVAEHRLRIEHNLIARPGVKLKNIRRVISSPSRSISVGEFLANQRNIRIEPFYDTAGSVKHVMAEGLTDTAAIASAKAADQYKAEIMKTAALKTTSRISRDSCCLKKSRTRFAEPTKLRSRLP